MGAQLYENYFGADVDRFIVRQIHPPISTSLLLAALIHGCSINVLRLALLFGSLTRHLSIASVKSVEKLGCARLGGGSFVMHSNNSKIPIVFRCGIGSFSLRFIMRSTSSFVGAGMG